MKNLCSEIRLIGRVTVLLQASKIDPLAAKYFDHVSFFLFSSYTPSIGLRFVVNLFGIIVVPISQPYPTRFQ